MVMDAAVKDDAAIVISNIIGILSKYSDYI